MPVYGTVAALVVTNSGGVILQTFLMCVLRYDVANVLLHFGHLLCSPMHALEWFVRFCFSLNFFPHCSHTNFSRSFCWCTRLSCCISPTLERHILWHPCHLHIKIGSVGADCDLAGFSPSFLMFVIFSSHSAMNFILVLVIVFHFFLSFVRFYMFDSFSPISRTMR